ncbi:restriction endonuclease subunit S [Acinetobacter pittii]|nr:MULTISPECIES: restriction endonuclease subunit S [Acinetobacter]AVZ06091.1 restriction endonuclease subunit S [Acinetobacter pittii]MCH2014170.1 restriction endonuclease subunit S [Acinetobacter pittii]MDH1069221.1 restriction endonuclease subunit S [Acinetobacter johnsonii]MDQ9995756.1 restriction endonuclease subunit S [Acinetobacter pittii]
MSSTLRLFWEAAGGNVPEHWEFKTIDELLEHPKAISVGVMYPGSDSDGGVPLIKVSDVKSGAIASRPSFCISNKVDEEYKRTRLNGSELLLTLVGNPGDCVIVTDEMCGWNVARALAVIRLKDTQLRSWIRYVLASKPAQHLIEARLNTTVQKTLNLKDVREIGIPIPPKEERDSITKTIDSIEKKTLINTKINQTLESIAQAIFKSWFIDFDPVRAKIAAKQNGEDPELAAMCAISGKSEEELQQMPEEDLTELQATAALFPDELVESELGEVPKGWSITKVDDILNRIKIKKRFKKNDVNSFGRTFVLEQGSNVILGFHNEEGSIPASKEEPAFIFGDHTCITKLMLSNFDVSENVIAVTGKKRNSYWTYYAIKDLQKFQEYRRHWMELTSKQVVIADINLTDYFAKKVKILHEDIEYSLRENLVLMNLRNTLLPKLLSGEISVSSFQEDTND